MTPDQQPGFHCCSFDTNLLEQVIELSVDSAVRQLKYQRGISSDSINQSEWVRIILHHMHVEMLRMAGNHELLPAEIDQEIDAEIAELVDRETQKQEMPECGSIVRPMHGLLRLPHHAGLLWRRLFEKRSE